MSKVNVCTLYVYVHLSIHVFNTVIALEIDKPVEYTVSMMKCIHLKCMNLNLTWLGCFSVVCYQMFSVPQKDQISHNKYIVCIFIQSSSFTY